MTLRAKIDLASGNFNMRDPVIYRINHMAHHRQGNKWCIYPMYDYAHPIEDMIEGITHSLCSLEFEDHRPLYNWVRDNVDYELKCKPRQIEFARLNLTYTIMSKRKLRRLVEEGVVSGWDDPRMPTLSGLRRRGYTPVAIRNFIERLGVAKTPSTADLEFLEYCLREDLNLNAARVMAYCARSSLRLPIIQKTKPRPSWLKTTPTVPERTAQRHIFRTLWVERDDFMEQPIKKYFRLYPGNEVRLKSAYIIKCTGCIKDAEDNVIEVLAEYDDKTRGGNTPDGRRVKGTIHWVDTTTAIDAEVRLYSTLFRDPDPESEGKDFMECLNPDSLEVLTDCKVELLWRMRLSPPLTSSCAKVIFVLIAMTASRANLCLTVQ